jgi:hypothetical protein
MREHDYGSEFGIIEDGLALGLHDVRAVIEDQVLPVARRARAVRAEIDNALSSYPETDLGELDELIEVHDQARNQVVRDHPEMFAIWTDGVLAGMAPWWGTPPSGWRR